MEGGGSYKNLRRKPKNASVGVRREEEEIKWIDRRKKQRNEEKKEKRNRTVKGRDNKTMGNCAR